jgi:dihydropteroate synthase
MGKLMLRDIYLRPLGLYPAAHAANADEVWESLRLAGGWLDYTAIEAIERNGSRIERRIVGMGGFLERDWGRRTMTASDLFEAMRAPRPRLAGLALDRPRVMGIVNVTPDSFSDGGQTANTKAAVAHALRLVDEGADILDIGGESTRPGAEPVSVAEELRRVIPVLEALSDKADALLSIDTRNAAVMRAAIAAGADVINDVSALRHDPNALATAADLDVPVILMHAQGDPRTMQHAPKYDHVLLDVFDYLEARIGAAVGAGIGLENIIVDPGIGFGKTQAHNLALMSGLALLHGLGVPVLFGASRKRVIGDLTGVPVAAERVHGSVGAALAAASQGAQIIRVHDVAATKQALVMFMAASGGTADSL